MASSAQDESPRPVRSASRSVPEEASTAVPGANALVEEVETLRRQLVALQRVSSLGVLAGGIIHELNNALTPILNYAKLGLRNPDPDYRTRALEKILDAAQRASAITGGVLGLARPRADRHEPTDLVPPRRGSALARQQGADPEPRRARLPGRRPSLRPGQPRADPAGAPEPRHQRPPGDARAAGRSRSASVSTRPAGWPRSVWPTPAWGSPRPTSDASSSRSSPPRPAPTPRVSAEPASDWPCAATSSRPTTAASAPRAASARGPPSPSACPPAPPPPPPARGAA